MIKRDHEKNKRLFINSYVEYYLATGRRPRGYDSYIYHYIFKLNTFFSKKLNKLYYKQQSK